jgi:hypothetical protein
MLVDSAAAARRCPVPIAIIYPMFVLRDHIACGKPWFGGESHSLE